MIISVDATKTSENLTPIHNKNSQQTNRKKIHNLTKTYEKSVANIVPDNERQNALPLKLRTTMSCITNTNATLYWGGPRQLKQKAYRSEKNNKSSLFTDNMITYTADLKKSISPFSPHTPKNSNFCQRFYSDHS